MSQCPVDHDEMIVYDLDGVEIDHCLTCRGTWLDGGELELLVERAEVSGESLATALHAARGKKHGERDCPRCGRRLELIELELGGKKLELDRCPRGDGLWFDQGELKAMIDSCSDDDDAAGALAQYFSRALRSELEGTVQADQTSD